MGGLGCTRIVGLGAVPCHSDGVAFFFSKTYFDVGIYVCRGQIIVLDHYVTIQDDDYHEQPQTESRACIRRKGMVCHSSIVPHWRHIPGRHLSSY